MRLPNKPNAELGTKKACHNLNNNLVKGVTSKSLSQQERNHKIFFSISKWVETTNREQEWIDMDFISFLWKKIQAECYKTNKIWHGSLKPTACFLTNKRCISSRRRTRHYILACCGLSLLDFPLVDDILNFIQFCFSSLLHRVVGDRQRKVKGVHWTSFDDHGVPTFFFYYLAQVLIGKICQFYLLTDLLENNPAIDYEYVYPELTARIGVIFNGFAIGVTLPRSEIG